MLATGLKTGTIFKQDNHPFVVEKYEHTNTARSGATVKVRARNLITNQISAMNFKGATKVEDAYVLRRRVQYLYKDVDYIFMDPDTFEQFSMTREQVGSSGSYLKEGELVQVLFFENIPVVIELPNVVVFSIIETAPGHKGNTVSSVTKDATISTGAVIKVPPFIKVGDSIKINTKTETYVSKA